MHECHTRAFHSYIFMYCWGSVHCTQVMFELQMECNLSRVKKGNQENNGLDVATRLFCNEGITVSQKSLQVTSLKGNL